MTLVRKERQSSGKKPFSGIRCGVVNIPSGGGKATKRQRYHTEVDKLIIEVGLIE